jgi:hypothetical protein
VKAFFVVFTLTMLIGVAFNLLWHRTADYEGAFYRALFFSISIPLASLLFRVRADFSEGSAEAQS